MAGLAAAARLRELGVEAVLLEKGRRPGGSMLLSSGVVWRHRSFECFRAECPAGAEEVQLLVWERLDDALDWLERLGAPVTEGETGNPRTVGRRFDPPGLTDTLVRAAGDLRLEAPLQRSREGPVVVATGGFAARLAREWGLPLRAAPWSDGDGIALARGRGAALSAGLDEFYGRAQPAPPARVEEADFVRAAQLYGRFAHVVDETGEAFFAGEPSWSETDLVQAIAHRPGGRAWYVVDAGALGRRIRERTVAEMVAVARELGGEVREAHDLDGLGLGPLSSPKIRRPPFTAVRVAAAVTHTIGGLRIDSRARVLDEAGSPLPGLYAAGVDAGGISTGGYASGLAAALVLGLVAAETAAADVA
jgi:succinate dehydrogenase/fumarate reductase flavoprotein subunit